MSSFGKSKTAVFGHQKASSRIEHDLAFEIQKQR
jgi:hypothetical protein